MRCQFGMSKRRSCWGETLRDNHGMAEQVQPQPDRWDQRRREAGRFWWDYVYTARKRYGLAFDGRDEMRVAINECFKKIDDAVSKAIETGCTYMYPRTPVKHPEVKILIFSDGKGKTFQRSLKMDQRFAANGPPLDFHDYWWFGIVISNLIFDEKKVKPDPRGGWLPTSRRQVSGET